MTKTITVSEETYEAIKSQLSEEEKVNISSLEDFVGKKIFVRTVTYHLVGKVEKVMGNLIELSDASWVADSGIFMDAIKKGELSEVEPVGQVFFNQQTIVDLYIWKHALPTEQK